MKDLTGKETYPYALSYYLNFPLVKPMFINFGLTHRCNLRCKICETWEENPNVKDELTFEELKKVIAQIADWGKINVSFAGGEPLIRKDDLLECIRFAKKMGLTTYVTTNGTFINQKVASEIIDSGLDHMQVSLDGAIPETNDYIRGKGAFKLARKALTNLMNAKIELNSPIKISITNVVTNTNLDEMLGIYEIVKDFDLCAVDYNPYNIDTSYAKSKIYEDEFWVKKNLEKLKKICKVLIRLKKKEGKIGTPYHILESMPAYFEKKKRFKNNICLAGFTYMYVKPNGEVDVCGKGPSLDVRNHGIKEIWFSLRFAKTRLLIRRCKRPCLMLCFPKINVKDFILGGFHEKSL